MSLANQVIVIYAGTNGFADDIPLDDMHAWESSLLRFMESSNPDIVDEIADKKDLTEGLESRLREALDVFSRTV